MAEWLKEHLPEVIRAFLERSADLMRWQSAERGLSEAAPDKLPRAAFFYMSAMDIQLYLKHRLCCV